MKNLLLSVTLSLSALLTANAQINFEDKNLALLEKIAFTTNYKTIKGLMEENNYSLQEESESFLDLPNGKSLDVVYLEFQGSMGNTVAVSYEKKNNLFLVVGNQIASINTVFCELELDEKKFKIKKENEDGKFWSQSSYKYQIITDKTDDLVHNIAFISPNHPEFKK